MWTQGSFFHIDRIKIIYKEKKIMDTNEQKREHTYVLQAQITIIDRTSEPVSVMPDKRKLAELIKTGKLLPDDIVIKKIQRFDTVVSKDKE
jgi:hypothetical protein